MHTSSFACSLLALVAGTFSSPQAQKKWDPSFDYTNLPPSNRELWTPLSAAQVTLEQALGVAQQAEGAPVRVLTAEMKLGQEAPHWHLQLFVGEPSSVPKRVNVSVSCSEPTVLKRLELNELIGKDTAAWAVLSKTEVTPEIAIDLAKERAAGSKAEPTMTDMRARKLVLVPEEKLPVWKIELMAIERRNEQIRRIELQISAEKPAVRQKLLLDRFVGEPLRAAEPTLLPNGMWIHDFHVGDGEELTAESKVKVNYRLFLLDGEKIFDTKKGEDRKSVQPEIFRVKEAPLKGMTEGMLGMRVGGSRKLVIPYELAFGEAGSKLAPPKASIVCDIVVAALVTE